jgi:hypothetical protein
MSLGRLHGNYVKVWHENYWPDRHSSGCSLWHCWYEGVYCYDDLDMISK